MREMMGIFGGLVAIGLTAAIVLPYLYRGRPLITPGNIVLLGGANFLGMATIASGFGEYVPDLMVTWHYYEDSVYTIFMMALVLFFIMYFAGYRMAAKPVRNISYRFFNYWPEATTGKLLTSAIHFAVGSIACFFIALTGIPIITQLARELFTILMVAAWGVALWGALSSKNKLYLFYALIFFAMSMMVATLGLSGRRDVVTVFGVSIGVWYWASLRYQPPTRALTKIVVLCFVLLAFIQADSVVRHGVRDLNDPLARGSTRLMNALEIMGMPKLTNMGGDTTDNSLWAIDQFYIRETAPQDPFAMVKYVALHPVPRAWYPEKPVGLGLLLPLKTDAHINSNNTWGPGIIGHCFYEGGFFMVIFYGLLIGALIRTVDEFLITKSPSPYAVIVVFLGTGQFLGLLRGDTGLFGVKVAFSFIAGIIVFYIYGKLTHSSRYYRPQVEEPALPQHAPMPYY